MIKYGVEQNEIIEYVIRKIKSGQMTYDNALSKCRQHGMIMDKDELAAMM